MPEARGLRKDVSGNPAMVRYLFITSIFILGLSGVHEVSAQHFLKVSFSVRVSS